MTRELSFQFMGSLNDFLPADRRWRRFSQSLRGATSVKDAIEGLGVPHTEIDVLIVDGDAGRFSRLLGGGETVTAYPYTPTLIAAGVARAGSDPPRPIRFVADIHLAKLASLLRLAGFDTGVESDDARLAAAASDARVALTRDVGLLKRSVVHYGYWVRATDPEQQFAEVLERYRLVPAMDPFTRCLRCNVRLVPVAFETIAGRLPPRVRESFREFLRCSACDRIYWRGSHHAKLAALLERISRQAAKTPSAADTPPEAAPDA